MDGESVVVLQNKTSLHNEIRCQVGASTEVDAPASSAHANPADSDLSGLIFCFWLAEPKVESVSAS